MTLIMGLISSFLGFRVFLFLFLLVRATKGQDVHLFRQTEQLGQRKIFNVMDYGAVEGGITDNSQVIHLCCVRFCDFGLLCEMKAGVYQ